MWPQLSEHAGPDKFFLGAVGSVEQLRTEVFHLSYRLHWTYSEVMDLDTAERREYVRMLADLLEREADALKTDGRR